MSIRPEVLQNYYFVTEQIKQVALRHNRDASKIGLLAVSKKQPPEIVQMLIDQFPGIMIGENYVQEFAEKEKLLKGDFKAHLIGPLQSNKIKKAVSLFAVIQSVSSLKIAEQISKEATKINKVQQIYLQVNISEDLKKSGFAAEELLAIFPVIKDLPNVEILGLMTITKYYSKILDVLPDFEQMVRLRDNIGLKFGVLSLGLSMGMSSDYQLAVQAGADLVRVGTDIFGKRLALDGS